MIRQALLIAVALAYSAAMFAVGRRVSRPASITAYTTAVAVLVAVPLFPEETVQRVDQVLRMAVQAAAAPAVEEQSPGRCPCSPSASAGGWPQTPA